MSFIITWKMLRLLWTMIITSCIQVIYLCVGFISIEYITQIKISINSICIFYVFLASIIILLLKVVISCYPTCNSLIFLNSISFLPLQMYLTTINMYSNHLNGLRSLLIYVINVKNWKSYFLLVGIFCSSWPQVPWTVFFCNIDIKIIIAAWKY